LRRAQNRVTSASYRITPNNKPPTPPPQSIVPPQNSYGVSQAHTFKLNLSWGDRATIGGGKNGLWEPSYQTFSQNLLSDPRKGHLGYNWGGAKQPSGEPTAKGSQNRWQKAIGLQTVSLLGDCSRFVTTGIKHTSTTAKRGRNKTVHPHPQPTPATPNGQETPSPPRANYPPLGVQTRLPNTHQRREKRSNRNDHLEKKKLCRRESQPMETNW